MDPTKGDRYAPAPAFVPPSVTGIPMNPASQMTQSQGPVLWSTGLCDCTEDVGNCKLVIHIVVARLPACFWFLFVAGCMTCWCPCVTFGRIADIVDRGSICKFLLICLVLFPLLLLLSFNWMMIKLCSLWGEWSTVHSDCSIDRLPVYLLMLLPIQTQSAVQSAGEPMCRFSCTLLLWIMRSVSIL